jgi:hypothetical protein
VRNTRLGKGPTIVFGFPPSARSYRQLRRLGYCQYVLEFRWQPIPLMTNPSVYGVAADKRVESIPKNLSVPHSFAPDSKERTRIDGRCLGQASRDENRGRGELTTTTSSSSLAAVLTRVLFRNFLPANRNPRPMNGVRQP